MTIRPPDVRKAGRSGSTAVGTRRAFLAVVEGSLPRRFGVGLLAFAAACGADASDEGTGTDASEVRVYPDPVHPPAESKSPLFRAAPQSVLSLTLEAPFDRLFARAKEGDPKTVFERGTVTYAAEDRSTVRRAIEVRVRGQSSLSECPFPKLKITFTEDVRGTVWSGLSRVEAGVAKPTKLKIGTHCGPPDLQTELHRVGGGAGPLREAFAYAALDVLGVPTHKVRLARITYVDRAVGPSTPEDLGPTERTSGSPRTIVQSALLLEDDDTLVDRYGATEIFEEDDVDLRPSMAAIGSGHLARHMFGSNLLGNWDWSFEHEPGKDPLHNVQLLRRDAGTAGARLEVVVAYDLDLSSIVTGELDVGVESLLPPDYFAEESAIVRQAILFTQNTRAAESSFVDAGLERVAAGFRLRHTAVNRLLDAWPFDERGRRLAKEHVDAFYRALDPDTLAQPMTARAVAAPGCGELPLGTPVKILETASVASGKRYRVRAIRAMGPSCDGRDVWVPGASLRGRLP